ncbi:hypothetical protein [Butyrivibrio sp. WCD3002]|uniref:hypothetical protein n=1 Tax=Butyrivibrio sp. WCD3002 TaxID=1280676 RepID=UPI000402EA25|nr:hypothetical protein [Butyrivibrio sp. WCD3002]
MVYALGYLNGGRDEFEKETYATDKIALHIERIREIITKRQVDASKDWKAFGESLSGETIPDFDKDEHIAEYKAGNREDTYLGRFFQASYETAVINQIRERIANEKQRMERIQKNYSCDSYSYFGAHICGLWKRRERD